MKSLSLQYISESIDSNAATKKGKTATVSIVLINGRKYAFKKYRLNAVDNLPAMEQHICSLFDKVGETKYNEMMLFGAFPKCLVYDSNQFCGFLMDVIPKECYSDNQKDRHLGAFYGIREEINTFSNQQIGQFVKNLGKLIFDLHENGFILGDTLNDQNIYVRVIDNQLYPFIVDTDSLRKDQENPAKTYHSPNFEPPEGKDSPSTKASDIYKYCLIVLRMFSKPQKAYERAGLRIEDDAAQDSLVRIKNTLGDNFSNIIVKGLSDNPKNRPNIQEIIESFSNKRKAQKINDDNSIGFQQNVIEQEKQRRIEMLNNMLNAHKNEIETDEYQFLEYCIKEGWKKKFNSTKEIVDFYNNSKKTIDFLVSINNRNDTRTTKSDTSTSSYSSISKKTSPYKSKTSISSTSDDLLTKNSRASILINIIASIIIIGVLLLSKYEIYNEPYNSLFCFIPLICGFLYIYRYLHGEWTKDDRIILIYCVALIVFNIVSNFILKDNLFVENLHTIIYYIQLFPILFFTTYKNINYLKNKNEPEHQLNRYRTISTVVYVILSLLLSNEIVHGLNSVNHLNDNIVSSELNEQANITSNDNQETINRLPHYYNLDIQTDSDEYYNSAFGSSCYIRLQQEYSEDELAKAIYQEFFNRMESDPLMATACLAYADRILGTRYTGKFYSEIENDWANNINYIAENFINNVWSGEVSAFEKMLSTATVSIDTVSNGNVDSFHMNKGDDHPIIYIGNVKWEGELHFITFTIGINENEFKLSYLVELGFEPVLKNNS